ncbi:AAA family ATPase [Streptacidiphilus sp. P02-A3a]|uniref:AAA family ATPase n=1 Tax=Streptacidiphilus sp. P02-A3a TaxID=2704468 RepID=UPI0015FD4B5D|nr:AAA family ATPase [Streptacidiphilus sp. P02-A3a]QMU67674.1 AAA family ATPase [Streptacidiphilus sp. P02-A3a]
MYLSRVRIDGIKGFQGERAVDLTLTRPDGGHAGWTVLAGRNSSGKTSLLQAVAAALLTPVQAYGLVPDLSAWQSADPGLIELTLTGSAADPAAAPGNRVEGVARRADIEVSCTWQLPPGREHLRPQVVWRRRPSGGADSAEADALADSEWEFALLGSIAGYGPYRRMSRSAARRDDRAFLSLFDEEAALNDCVAWLVDADHRRLEGRPGAAETVEAVLGLLGDGLLPDGLRVSGVSSEGLSVTDGSREFPLIEMSQGVRTAVALAVSLIWELAREDPAAHLRRRDGRFVVSRPGIVLIDEIDAHLHVTWQQRIGYWLKAHFPEIQFLVTTHSPYICQAADPNGLIRLGAPGDGTAPAVVDEELYRRVVYGSGDDAILSELFGLESPFSAEAEQLRRRAGDLEDAMLDGEATDNERREFDELSEKLSSSLSTRAAEVAARLGRPT